MCVMTASLNAPSFINAKHEISAQRIQIAERNKPKLILALEAEGVFHINPRLIVNWAAVSLLFKPDEPPSV